jgi:hypothetical protein
MSSSKKRSSSHVSATPPRVTRLSAISLQARSPVRSVKVARRSARINAPITCCEFGLDRAEKFPNADFCHPCKMWDERDISNTRANRHSKRYACQRTHESIFAPQQKEVQWWNISKKLTPLSPIVSVPSYSCSSKAIAKRTWWKSRSRQAAIERNHFTQQLEGAMQLNDELNIKLEEAQRRAEKLRLDLKKANKELKRLQIRVKKLKEDQQQRKPSSMKDALPASLDFLIHTQFPRFRLKSLLKDISEAVWSWRDGVCQDFLIEKAKKHLKANVFSPLRICRAMDLFGGMLNFQSLRVLRWIESDATQERANLLFPSPTMLSRFITNFTGFCSSYVKVNFFTNQFGEGFEFDHKQVISLMWKHTGKDVVAEERPTKLVLTSDGSKLTNNINVVLMGLKEVEAYESMPLIGSRLLKFSNNFDTEADGSLSVQSAFLSFPIMAQLGPESGDVIDLVFKRKYHSIIKATIPDELGRNIWFPNWKPFDVYCPSDQKFSWLACKAGGAAKVKKFFCQYCITTSSDIDKANDQFCEHCSKLSDEHRSFPFPNVQWECLHHEFITDTMIARMRDQLQTEYPPDLQQLHKEIMSKTKLKLFQDAGDRRAIENKFSIDYEPQSISELDCFHLLLTQEARLRKIFSWNTWGVLRTTLKSKLLAELSLEYLLSSIDHITTKADALYFIRQAIPCILHLENRTLLKLFFLMLREGLANAQGKLHEETMAIPSMEGRESRFVEVISQIMNEQILGSLQNRAQWKMPTESSRGESLKIGTINIENYRGRKIMENFHTLVDHCIVEDDKRQKWRYAVNNYNSAMVILRQKEKYSTDDIFRFQLLIDRAYLVLRSMYKRDIATNYFHMLSSRHIAWFMETCGPLNNYSNQGFEALNRLMKRYLNTRTNKGGGRSRCKSKLRPIANLFLRRLIWTFEVYKEYNEKETYTNGSTVDSDIFD